MSHPTDEIPPGAEWDPVLEMWTINLKDPGAEEKFFEWRTQQARKSHPRKQEIAAVVEKFESLRPTGMDGAWVVNNCALTSIENLARLAVEVAAEARGE